MPSAPRRKESPLYAMPTAFLLLLKAMVVLRRPPMMPESTWLETIALFLLLMPVVTPRSTEALRLDARTLRALPEVCTRTLLRMGTAEREVTFPEIIESVPVSEDRSMAKCTRSLPLTHARTHRHTVSGRSKVRLNANKPVKHSSSDPSAVPPSAEKWLSPRMPKVRVKSP